MVGLVQEMVGCTFGWVRVVSRVLLCFSFYDVYQSQVHTTGLT